MIKFVDLKAMVVAVRDAEGDVSVCLPGSLRDVTAHVDEQQVLDLLGADRVWRGVIDLYEVEVEVEGDFHPGLPATGPRYDCAGDPATPDEVDNLRAYLDGVDVTRMLTDLAAIEADYIERAGR